MDVARGYSIACHHNDLKYDHFAAEYSERTGIPTIALGDSTGMRVKNHEILVIGPSSAKVLNGEKSSIFRKGAVLGLYCCTSQFLERAIVSLIGSRRFSQLLPNTVSN